MPDRDLNGVDMWTKNGIIAAAGAAHGDAWLSMAEQDIDLATHGGRRVAYTAALRIKAKGCLWAVIPTTTWVHAARFFTGRSDLEPCGSENQGGIRAANKAIEVFCAIAFTCYTRGVHVALVAPPCLVWRYPCMKELIRTCCTTFVRTYMGSFGLRYARSIDLITTCPLLSRVRAPKPRRNMQILAKPSDPAMRVAMASMIEVTPSFAAEVSFALRRLVHSR